MAHRLGRGLGSALLAVTLAASVSACEVRGRPYRPEAATDLEPNAPIDRPIVPARPGVGTSDAGASASSPSPAEMKLVEQAFSFLAPDFPGVSFVARYCGKTLVFTKGKKKYGEAPSIVAQTPMRLSSNSKAFTALAILSLASKGKLDLRATLEEIFPPEALPRTPENAMLRAVTVTNLLQMQSGIAAAEGDTTRCESYANWVTTYTDEEVFRGLVRTSAEAPNHLDGVTTAHRYCNANYAILVAVVERVTGGSFEAVVKEITDKLQMGETGIIDYANPSTSTLPGAAGKVWGHEVDATNVPRPTNADGQSDVGIVGDGEVWSTANDMGKWLGYWMRPSVAGEDDVVLGRAVLAPDGAVVVVPPGKSAPTGSVALRQAAFTEVGSAGANYAFGWTRYGDWYELGKGVLVAHGGATEGFRSTVEFYPYPTNPADRAGYVLMSNYHDIGLDEGNPEHRRQFKAAEGVFAKLAKTCAP